MVLLRITLIQLLAVIALVLLPASHAIAQSRSLPADGTPITEVKVEGLSRVAPIDVLRVMELREGTKFSAEAYRRDLQAISNIGTINPIDLKIAWERNDDEELILTVMVRENPVINSISVIGNVAFSRAQILNELDYDVGDMEPTGIRQRTIRNLGSFYRNGGYKEARVRVSTQPVEGREDAVDVFITIDERERIRIRKFVLNGNTHLNTFLTGQKITNGPGLLFFDNYYDETGLQEDLQIIRQLYLDDGFLDVSVRRGTFIYDEEKKDLDVVIDVTQGPRYSVVGTEFEGITYFNNAEVEPLLSHLPGKLFSGSRMTRALQRLRTLYGNQGYIDTEITYRLVRDPLARTAVVVFIVRESQVSYVGEIRLNMEDYDVETDLDWFNRTLNWLAPPTREETIRRELRLKTGAKYRTADEVRSVERLKNLGIFRTVEVDREPTGDPSVKDVTLSIEEDPAAAFVGVTAGVGEYSGPTITFRVTQPNVGGRADRAYASATFGTRTSAYRIGYFDRYLGQSDYSMEVSLYRLTDRFRVYRQRIYGGEAEVGKPLRERLFAYLRLRAENVKFPSHTKDAEERFDEYNVLAVRPYIVYDGRDNRTWPTRGYLVSGGFETGWADGTMFKALHAYEWYHQFDRSEWIYAYEHTVGLMPYTATDIGISERFYVGGSGTLRGFRYREVGPRDPRENDLAIGGSTRITQRHELRYPITEALKGRFFVDGAVLEKGPLELGPPRVGGGAGIIIDLGPVIVEVDLATPLWKEKYDRAQYFHLRLGSDF